MRNHNAALPCVHSNQILFAAAFALLTCGMARAADPAATDAAPVATVKSARPELGAVLSSYPRLTSVVHRTRGDDSQIPGGPGGGCPAVMSTYSSDTFVGTLGRVTEQGMVEGEIAATSYVLNASDFPVRFRKAEIIWAQGTSSAPFPSATTTQYTVIIWRGRPDTGTQIDSFTSDDQIMSHIHIPSGNGAVIAGIEIDPSDLEQIDITDDGSHTISIGFRIDHHNNPFNFPPFCQILDPTSNAFPTVDANGVANTQNNWLFGATCSSQCPGAAGWHRFANLGACRPSGDWNIRITYEPISCPLPPTITNVAPNSAYNLGTQHVTVTGTHFVSGATDVRLSLAGQGDILGANVQINQFGTILNTDFNLTGAAAGAWTLKITTSDGNATQSFPISAPPAPTINSFSPSLSTNDHKITLAHAQGGGFVNGMSVEFDGQSTSHHIDATDIAVSSAGGLQCSVDAQCAPPDFYTCTVTTPNGNAALTNALHLIATAAAPIVNGADISSTTNCPGTLSLTVFGQDFRPGATVFLKQNATLVPATSVSNLNSFSLDAQFDRGALLAGNWNVRVVNPDCRFGDSLPANYELTVSGCIPTVSAITPNTANNHQTALNVTNLAGTNLLSGATVTLKRSGQTDITATNVVSSLNNTKLTCTLNLLLVQTGTWNVQVTNPGGGTSNTNITFSVMAGPVPTVALVTAANPGNCGSYNATINGANYLTGASARIILSGQSDIVATSVVRNSAASLSATFDLTAAAVTSFQSDKWDCRVTNPDGQSSTNGIDKINVTCCAATYIKGDMDGNSVIDARDVQAFVRVLLNQTGSTADLCHADTAAPAGTINAADAAAFVACLLGNGCPP